MSKKFINCTGIVCFKDDEILLVRRGNPPRKGEWSIPGGKIEFGESETKAALRELYEETGIKASIKKK
ncbi:NUDIX domain-containing protein [Hellea sp.]|nr:NUDIX domain-containing protein [Hellea sp.]MDC1089172.1 NUDIX domain-containing protein [Hellea sp.]